MVPRPSRKAPSVEDANYLGRGAHAPLPHPLRVPAMMSSPSAPAAFSLLTSFQSTSTTTGTRALHLPSLCDGQSNSTNRRRRLDSGLPTVRQSDRGEHWKRRVLPLAPGFFARTVRSSIASTAHCPAGKGGWASSSCIPTVRYNTKRRPTRPMVSFGREATNDPLREPVARTTSTIPN